MKNTSSKFGRGFARFGSFLCLGLLSAWPTTASAQVNVTTTTPSVNVKTRATSDAPQAVVTKVRGQCEISERGQDFTPLKVEQIVSQGAIIRTGEGDRVDLFFRRVGTSVRVQQNSEVVIETMKRTEKGDDATMETLLHLRKGRIFTAVRSLVAGSKFEIRNAAGRSVVEGGGGAGRYIITADGTHVTEQKSTAPIKLVRETGITVIEPGFKFDSKEGKVFPVDAPEVVNDYVEFDEIEVQGEQADAAPKK